MSAGISEPHQAPDLMGRFVYGIPELHRAAIAASKTVAAAGCYPTVGDPRAAAAAGPDRSPTRSSSTPPRASAAPARALKDITHFNTVDENMTAYGLLNHRHTAEMEMELGGKILFTPHLAPMNRGILATCTAIAKGPCDPLAALREAYADEPFVHVSERRPRPNGRWVQRRPSHRPL